MSLGKASIINLVFFALIVSGCTSSLSGQLRSTGGDVITSEDARVNITRLDGSTGNELGEVKESKSESLILPVNDSGEFSTDAALSNGNYLIEALVPGYKVTSVRVTLEGTKKVDLTVVPLTTVKAESVGTNEDLDMSRGSGGATLTPPGL